MVSVRLTDAFRLIVVGAPDYLDKHGTPARPEDLLHHECLTFRSSTTGALYAWELERGRRTWRIPVRGGLLVNDGLFCTTWAEQGLGLAYVMEPLVKEQLRTGALRRVLEPYAASVPGFFFSIRVERRAPRRSDFSWRRFASSRRRRWPPERRRRRSVWRGVANGRFWEKAAIRARAISSTSAAILNTTKSRLLFHMR